MEVEQSSSLRADRDESGYQRLEDQINWYDHRSMRAQRSYRALKAIQIIVAALIPVSSLVRPTDAVVPGVLGAIVLILEGFQELGMHRQNWQKYRSSCEALRHEKYLFMAKAGPYAVAEQDGATKLLAIRVEELVSDEHRNWANQFSDNNGNQPK